MTTVCGSRPWRTLSGEAETKLWQSRSVFTTAPLNSSLMSSLPQPEEGAEVIRIIELALQSISERRTVDVPPRL